MAILIEIVEVSIHERGATQRTLGNMRGQETQLRLHKQTAVTP